MTDNDIIKALEHCIKCNEGPIAADCTGCLLEKSYPYCDDLFEKMCLVLAKRQQAEIERLQGEVDMYEEERKYHFEMSRQRIIEAIKKFAERVKESPRKISMMSFTEEGISTYVPVHAIDNLVKEMTEGVCQITES